MANSSYDQIAGMYHELWADWYLPAARPALERLFFSQVAPGSRVLDLCCGSGHVTRELVERGYRVNGVDNSAELIALARREVPEAEFEVQDACSLRFTPIFDACLSTFDSLNHVLSLEGLRQVFEGVYNALRPGGLFLFDMNLEQAYSADLWDWSVDVKDDSIGLVRGKFDWDSKRASTELIWFLKSPASDCWTQRRSVVEQQCYSQTEILQAVIAKGFRNIEAIDARDAGVYSKLAFGRTYFTARRPL
jgi:SAM-dependent methyltransferase